MNRATPMRGRLVYVGFACAIASWVVAGTQPALAADEPAEPTIVIVAAECLDLSAPASPGSPRSWDALVSFAACIQDASVYEVTTAAALPELVEQLEAGIRPSLGFYSLAVSEGPDSIRWRGAYAIGLSLVALITRARTSLRAPELRDQLEELLEPHARFAYLLFTSIVRASALYPELVPEAVTRYMVRSSRELADALSSRWSMPALEDLEAGRALAP